MTRWTRQIASLLSAGLPIDRALLSAAEYQNDRPLRDLSIALEESLRAGLSISSTFDTFARHFDVLYRQVIASGEVTGSLGAAFSQIADYREKSDRARARLRRAASYPIVVFAVAVAAVAFLLVYVVPTYQTLYAEFDAQLPGSTQLLIQLGGWLQANIWWLAGILLMLVATTPVFSKVRRIRRWASSCALGLWPLSLLGRPGAWARIARGMGSMLSAGVLLQETLSRARDLSGNVVLAETLDHVADRVAAGEPLADALSQVKYVEPIVIQMAGVGEDTGTLGPALIKAGEFLETEIDQRTEAMLTLAEPLLILVVGAVVGTILLALYLPMFELVSQTG